MLGARVNLNHHIAVQGANLHFRAENCLTNVQVKLCMDVRPFSLEIGVISNFNVDD